MPINLTIRQRFKLVLALAVFTLAFTSFRMYSLYQQEKLWGYLPFFWLLGFWTIIILIRSKRFFGDAKKTRWFVLATASGILLTLGFPPIPAPVFLFVGLIPILYIADEINADEEIVKKGKTFALYTFYSLTTWNILTTWWVANASLASSLLAIGLNSLFMMIPLAFYRRWILRFGTRWAIPVFATLWLSYEYGHLRWDLTWPWLILGNGLAMAPKLIQWYSITGVPGGTLWIIVANFLLYRMLKSQAGFSWQRIMPSAAWLLIPCIISLIIYHNYKETGTPREVIVVQPNYEPFYQKFNVPEDIQIPHLLACADSLMKPNSDYLVFPETSFGAVRVGNENQYPAVIQLRNYLAKYPQCKLISGIDAVRIYPPGSKPNSKFVRTQVYGRDTTLWESYNASTQLTANSDSFPLYLKSKLVPGPEILPFKQILFFLEPIFAKMGGTTAGLGTQPERTAFKSNSGSVGTAICYESVFGNYAAGYIRAGAQALFVVTNDGWWDDTPGYRQHFQFARLRAIETRRDIARAANSGSSGFINQRGDVLQASEYNKALALRGTLHFNEGVTVYVRWGDFIGLIAILLTLVLGGFYFLNGRLK